MKTLTTSIVLATCLFVLTSSGDTTTILGGGNGNADFEASEPASGFISYVDTANWFNASGSEELEFTSDSQTAGSSAPNSRACIPFHDRVQVNDTPYTVAAEGEVFSLSFDFGRTGENWDGDESYRAFLFTSSAPVDGSLTTAEITEVAAIEYEVPSGDTWENQIQFNAFYVSNAIDVGQTFFLGMVLTNLNGEDVFPRLDEINLVVQSNVLSGDLNSDGVVNLLDVSPFVELIASGAYQIEADINLDGVVNLLDVAPFVEVLVDG